MRVLLQQGLVLGGLLLLAACQQRSRDAGTAFRVDRISPEPAAGQLLLNDAITVYFSEAVDPMSVTRDSFAVLDRDGHAVPGQLNVDGNWVTFEPDPPLGSDLLDGSLQPDSEYRLAVRGYPQPDGVRSRRGALLTAAAVRPFRTAGRSANGDLPAPLRPLHTDTRPFVLRPSEFGRFPVPVDDARIQLHFTLPVLPTSVSTAAVELSLFRHGAPAKEIERIEPRLVRLLPRQPIDDFAGCTVELEIGANARIAGDPQRTVRLEPDDLLAVQLATGATALRDYAGRTPPPPQVQWCNIVAGTAVKVAEWPTGDGPDCWLDSDLATPGFEIASNMAIQPLVRAEAGSGALGVFRPRSATTIRIGEAFDRGDGVSVVSTDGTFAFLAIDIPAGVTVRLECGKEHVGLLALGRARIAGVLELVGDAAPGPLRAGQFADAATIRGIAAVTIVAGSGIEVRGEVRGQCSSGGPLLALVTAGVLDVGGSIPLDSVLATERGGAVSRAAERCVPLRVRMSAGLPPGVEVLASGYSPFATLPVDRAIGSVRLRPMDSAVRVAWQVVARDAVNPTRPDLDPARSAPPREVVDGQRIEAAPGSLLRIRCQAHVVGGEPLPRLLGIDVLDG